MLTAIIKMQNLMNDTRDLFQDRRGATAIEYGLIAGLIAVVIIACGDHSSGVTSLQSSERISGELSK